MTIPDNWNSFQNFRASPDRHPGGRDAHYTAGAVTMNPGGHSLRFHAGFLHVTLLEALHPEIPATAESLRKCIDERAQARLAPLEIPWVPELSRREVGRHETHFLPRIYTTWGTFDIGAVYLSPDTRVHTHSDSLSAAGQNLDVAFLPVKPDDWTGSDFNEEYIRSFVDRPPETGDALEPPDFRFFCSFRLKLSPGAVWPERFPGIDEAQTRFYRALQATWHTLADWAAGLEPDGGQRHVALGLCVGWNEFLIVAHAANPGSLLDLILDVRRTRVPAGGTDPEGPTTAAFETSFSTFGCDEKVFRLARDTMGAIRNERGGDGIEPGDLMEVADRVARMLGETGQVESGGAYLRPSFHVYPGHERSLLWALERAMAALPQAAGRETPCRCTLEVGKQDILGPLIHFSRFRGPASAVAYLSALLEWLQSATLKGGPSATPFPRFFDTYTRFGRDEGAGEEPGDAPEAASPFEIRDLAPRVQKIFENPIQSLKADLRVLQVPYETTDRLAIMANAIAWAWQRQVPSDESLELVPAFLCLRAALEDARLWWETRSLEPHRRPARYRTTHQQISPADETFQLTRKRLERLNKELRTLFDGIRWSFSARQLTSYVLGDFADLNLRFRGSFHQLLSVANLMVDSLVGQLIGRRATIASIGIAPAPEMTSALDVILIDLPANALGNPFLLESIGHEVGHQLLRDLIAAVDSGDWTPHRWKRWTGDPEQQRKLVHSLRELDAEVFLGILADETSFIESTSDLIERLVLDYEDFNEWVKSFTLRAVLASLAIQQDQREDRLHAGRPLDAEVPQIPNDAINVIIERVVLVAVAEELMDWDPDTEDFVAFRDRLDRDRLAGLRRFLFEECVLGPTRDAYEFLRHEGEWQSFLSEYVFDLPAPWLADSDAARLSSEFFRNLRDLCRRPLEADEQSPAHFLPVIRDAFRDLRRVVLEMATPSLHVRHNLKPEDARSCWDKGPRKTGNEPWIEFPWRAVRQPLSQQASAEGIRAKGEDPAGLEDRYRMVVGQRGSMLPLDLPREGELTAAVARFYWNMITLVAAWRRGILETMETVEARDADGNATKG